jgi:hypothetical protein
MLFEMLRKCEEKKKSYSGGVRSQNRAQKQYKNGKIATTKAENPTHTPMIRSRLIGSGSGSGRRY